MEHGEHDRDLDSEPTISAWTSEVDEEALLHYGILPLKQDALENIVASRRREGLPPFFAVLSNQIMERPYRMDKLSISIGRWDAKDPCDVSVGSDPHLLTHQWTIRYSYARGCYVLESAATHPKPFALKLGKQRYEYRGPRARVALPNPALIDFAGSYWCFQIFAIAPTNNEQQTTPESDEERSPVTRKRRAEEGPGSVESIAPMSTKRRNQGQLGKKRRGVTYVKMVEQALANLGGSATHREICAYIEKNFTDFLTNQNWQASISVTLSATEKFQRRNTMRDVDGKKEKTSVWVLSGTGTDQASDD